MSKESDEKQGCPESISRRNFLFGAGAVTLGAATLGAKGIGLAGSATNEGTMESGKPVVFNYADTIPWDAEYDVVVVGFGGAGAVTSITAADEGAKVLLLEKAPFGDEGGNTRYCAQAILTFNDFDGGVKFMKSMAEGFDTATDEIIDFMVQGSIDNKEWIISMGGEPLGDEGIDVSAYGFTMDSEVGDWIADNGRTFAEYPERIMPGGDSAYVANVGGVEDGTKKYWKLVRKNVVDRADRIDVWFESPALKLIQDPFSKTIIGLRTRRNDTEVNVRARNGVVLACGSYEASQDKYETYAGLPLAYPMGTLFNTGDGIDMAIDVGADLWHMSCLSGPWLAPKYPDQKRTYFIGMTQRLTAAGNCIYVGGDGTRFVAESGWQKHGHINYSGTWRSQVAPDVMYAVFDQTGRSSAGSAVNSVDPSLIISADTVAELAVKIDIDAEALSETVKRYNGYVDSGFDEQFERHPTTLAKVETAPYYAVRLYPGCVNVQGGPKRNIKCEVLDTDGNPIPHLYSAGELGSFWAGLYDGGGNIAETMYSGRAAGKSAAAQKVELSAVELTIVESALKNFGNDLDHDSTVNVTLDTNEYLGIGQGLNGPIVVKVKIEAGRVLAVEVIEQHETVGVTDKVWATMPQAMVAVGSADVDTVSGATSASRGLIEAVNNAVSQA